MRRLCTIVESGDLELHGRGLALAQEYQLPIFDSMLLAAALRAECRTFLSEDLHDGLIVEKVLIIRNPFA